jgi:hypothetical protein
VAAWHEPPRHRLDFWAGLAFAVYLTAWAGLLGMILWKLWTGYNLGGILP